ncbi:hypothetical protein WICMUC_005377 [Wickerhamomyces mucosus]|uniref:Nuclear pore complex protein n=1 Tax=Wickerhamomyces mucosus TaxID=1378264 RepID=A0A9P8P8L9_9ASCO|nr:hypothetical protein WICMUC_005377 [Wickerhamomyces mucosus]
MSPNNKRNDLLTIKNDSMLVDFANVLREYHFNKTAGIEDLDIFDIVREYRSIASLNVLKEAERNIDTSEFEDWALEVKLWHLIELLLSFRTSEKPHIPEPDEYKSNFIFSEKIYQSDPQLYEIFLLINWIHENSIGIDRPDGLIGVKWLNTQLDNTLENLDSDAPIRLDKNIKIADVEQDKVFFKYVFELLLAGEFEEALVQCEKTNNWTLKMILSGRNEYLDPIIDRKIGEDDIDFKTHGIKKKALWRRAVYLLSKNEHISEYERAIYGFLAGDLSPLEVSESWDSELLIYLNYVFTNEVENRLIELNRIPKDELITGFPKNKFSIQKILNLVADSRKLESEHPLRMLIASVISNNISSIIHSSLSFVGNIMTGNEDTNEILNESYALRVITHIAIVVSEIDTQLINLEDKSKLITTYILILRFYENYELIPLYVSFLPEVEARDTYSLFLMDLFDSRVRSKQLELSRLYKLPLEDILNRTVDRAFALTENHYRITKKVTLQHDIDEIDNKLIRAVEWFVEAEMCSDAIRAILSLFRRFLLNGKIKSIQFFTQRNNIGEILKLYDVQRSGASLDREISEYEREELLQYETLNHAFDALDKWRQTQPQTSTQKQLLLQRKTTITFVSQVNDVSQILHNVINNLFKELSITEYESELIEDLRSLYIPFLIIQLHYIYIEARIASDKFVAQALQLANLVASESNKFYILFQKSDRLREYLSLVAQGAALSAGDSF